LQRTVVGKRAGVNEQRVGLIGVDGAGVHQRHAAVADVARTLNGFLVGQRVRRRRAEDVVVGIVGHGYAAAAERDACPVHH
jgi:hypothetical protein